MKSITTFFIFFIAALSFQVSARAEDQGRITDGNSLQRNLRLVKRYDDGVKLKAEDVINVFYTIGYMKGVVEGLEPWFMCDAVDCPYNVPSVPASQFIQVVEKYLNNHPEELHQPASLLIFAAVSENFPNAKFQKKPQDSGLQKNRSNDSSQQ
jgi:hypothetical protein